MKLTVIGAGSFGSALAELAGRCEHEVLLWAHDPKVAESIAQTRSNPYYLPAAQFPSNVAVTNSLREAAEFSDTILMVAPSHHVRNVLGDFAAYLDRPVSVISATKGIENESLLRMSQVAAEVLGDRLAAFACLSGPTFALEVSRQDPSAAVIAATDEQFGARMQAALSCRFFRLYRSRDVVGVELAGALKNVIAIAAGVIEGVGLGTSTMAALVTRGLHEIKRLGVAMGGGSETFAGLAGMGDLVLTCTGKLSRNRSVGVGLGQGKTLTGIVSESRLVAEGIRTCRSARDLALRHDIEMPIIFEMYRVLYEEEPAPNAIQRLMTRALRMESDPDATQPKM